MEQLALDVADAVEVVGELVAVMTAADEMAAAREWLERGRRAAEALDADPEPLEAAAAELA